MRRLPLLSLLFVAFSVNAQYNTDAVFLTAFQIPIDQEIIEENEIDSLLDLSSIITSELFHYQATVGVPDTLSLVSFAVQLSDASGVFNSVDFQFDQEAPSGYEYLREGESILLSLGDFEFREEFQCEVIFFDNTELASEPVIFNVAPIDFDDE